MQKVIPNHLETELNASVVQFLEGKSSHGDLSELFHKTITNLDNANSFTPADRPYAYYLAYANVTIFGFCESMKYVSFRLPELLHNEAFSDGGVPHKLLSRSGWIDFPAWGSAKSNHARWAKEAYLYALS